MSKNASIHLTILIGNFGFKFFNKKYQNCSSACVLFYMSALCSGCLHYAPSSHSKAPHNHFKWSQMTTYSINFPSLYWLFFMLRKKTTTTTKLNKKSNNERNGINRYCNSAHSPSITRIYDQFVIIRWSTENSVPPPSQLLSYKSKHSSSFLFSTFLSYNHSNPAKSELLWAITDHQNVMLSVSSILLIAQLQNFSAENSSHNTHKWKSKMEV